MKCPKCGYLGFEHVERCRNCGYDFSLTPVGVEPELSIKSLSATPDPEDFALPEITLTRVAAPAPPTASELPLFESDEPLITRPSPPRAPLAVRRSTPEVPRLRTPPRPASLDFPFEDRTAGAAPPPPIAPDVARPLPAAFHDADQAAAGLGARFGAVCIDLAILAAVDLAVVYFTLQVCGIALEDLALVPKAPLAAFLLVQNLGYLVAFNAGGQTLGKMAMGIRVVSDGEFPVLDIAHALVRTAIWVALAVPAGLGFLTAFPGRDHRGLHDRFAGTRVVRA